MSAKFAKRFEAIFLCLHPKGPKMQKRQAAKYIKKSEMFVTKWIKHYSQHKNVDDLPNRGRNRRTTDNEDKVILKIFNKNPTTTLAAGKQKLEKMGINICRTTIKKRLAEYEIKQRSTLLKPLLKHQQVKKRLTWAQSHLNRDWSNVVFTDEASFQLFNSVKRTWSTKGNKVVQRTVKHPGKVHVWGCFTNRGFGKLILFTQNLDAKYMNRIYKCGLLPSTDKWFGKGNRDWILQEDNDPKHRSRLCSVYKEENGINTLDWPSQSPDANPIENVWGLMKVKLRGKKIKNIAHLCRVLKKIWRELLPSYAEKLVQSMHSRCQQILDSNGDWIPY